jgi:hypothetical protein
MAEPLRNDEELTTADLVGRTEKPKLVRNERPAEPEIVSDARDRMKNTMGADTSTPVTELDNRPALANRAASNMEAVGTPAALFSETDVTDSRSRWSNIQAAFVDEPRKAVEDADSLVASLMKKLAEGFANERERLEKQWDRGEDVSTEDLRIALQRYRSFFDRLLKV